PTQQRRLRCEPSCHEEPPSRPLSAPASGSGLVPDCARGPAISLLPLGLLADTPIVLLVHQLRTGFAEQLAQPIAEVLPGEIAEAVCAVGAAFGAVPPTIPEARPTVSGLIWVGVTNVPLERKLGHGHVSAAELVIILTELSSPTVAVLAIYPG